MSIRSIALGVGCWLAAAALAYSQGAQPSDTRKAEEVYKNIKVMNGTLASEFSQSMHLMESGTGMDCEYCHIEGKFDVDVKPPKQVARRMYVMMTDLNTRYFGGKQVVTCYTCHNGRREPAAMPFLPITKPLEPGEMEAKAKLPMPPVQQILDRYIEALGGEQNIRKVTSRVITGTQYIPTGPGGQTPAPATIERAQKAPNMIVNTYKTATFTIADGFDGKTSWSQNQQGRTADAIEVDQPRARRDADFYFPLNLKQQYATMTVEGIDRVSDRDAYVVVATPQGEVPERLYFDTQTGLLLRKATALPTQIGFSPFQVNYSDYRDAGNGVKVPYVITMYPASSRTVLYTTATIRVMKVEENVTIDDAKFARPR